MARPPHYLCSYAFVSTKSRLLSRDTKIILSQFHSEGPKLEILIGDLAYLKVLTRRNGNRLAVSKEIIKNYQLPTSEKPCI